MTSIKNAKLNSRNIERKPLKTLELSIKETEFNRQQAHVEIKKEGVEIKKPHLFSCLKPEKSPRNNR